MIKTEYWNGKEWVKVQEFESEKMCWIALGGDNMNYRTVDSDGNVLTDKSSDKAKAEQRKL